MFRIFGTDCDRSFGSIGIGSAPKTDRNKITEKEWFLENKSKKEKKTSVLRQKTRVRGKLRDFQRQRREEEEAEVKVKAASNFFKKKKSRN